MKPRINEVVDLLIERVREQMGEEFADVLEDTILQYGNDNSDDSQCWSDDAQIEELLRRARPA